MAGRVQTESAQRTSATVTELLRKQPFFGSLALRLPLRADPSRQTLASDGHEIRYSPRWIAETDAHVIETAMARVVMACALKHHTRRGERDPERWQQASQLVTHALVRDAGFALPPEAEAWDGLSVEQAYDRLPEPEDGDPDDDDNAPSGGGSGAGAAGPSSPGDDDGKSDSSSESPDDGGDEDGDARDGDGQDDGSDTPASHDPSGTGEIMDAGARAGGNGEADESPVDVIAEEQAWDEAMHQALNLAKAEGKAPGGVEETVKGAHASMLDWRALLRRYMTDAARRDYSWSLPNRRFIDAGLYLPSIRSEGIDAIAVIVDTSGSLPAATLAEFWAELREVATELQPERVIVLQVDSALQYTAEYTADDLPDEIVIRGRGGTDFRPGFAWLDEQDIRPGVCLYFTDMECSSYPETEPDFEVIWVNWGPEPGDLEPGALGRAHRHPHGLKRPPSGPQPARTNSTRHIRTCPVPPVLRHDGGVDGGRAFRHRRSPTCPATGPYSNAASTAPLPRRSGKRSKRSPGCPSGSPGPPIPTFTPRSR